MGPLLDNVGPRIDGQFRLGVLLSVLTALTTWSSSAVSTLMFLKKSMVGADLGGFVLELVGGLDLEGPSVGGKQPSQLGSSWQSPSQHRSS